MNRTEILDRLNEITSPLSFGRVLGIIECRENTNLFSDEIRNSLPNQYRLINQEISFLAGLWMYNIDITKNGWDIQSDDQIVWEVYSLMDALHHTYKFNIETPYNEQLMEISFYEGDAGYDWQFIKFVQPKYTELSEWLQENFNYDIELINRTYYHIKNFINEQFNRRRKQKQAKKEYISFFNIYTISEKKLIKEFTIKEQKIIEALTFKLGSDKAFKIEDIGDDNTFHYKPIIHLPNRGYFIINYLNLAVAMNELPFHWIMRAGHFNTNYIGNLRGKAAENIIFSILKNKYGDNCDVRQEILIKKTKSANVLTDIDILHIYKENAIVFQIKSKRLTQMSKQGNYDSINKDFTEAIADAYEQGCKCINSLAQYSEFYTLKKIQGLAHVTNLHNICITLDQYPTISSITYLKSAEIEQDNIPLIAMSTYDLATIVYLFSQKELFDYINFRADCAKNKIYGISEIYFIGAYLSKVIYRHTFLPSTRLERHYAQLVDYVIKIVRKKHIQIQSLNDIENILTLVK